MAVGTDVSGKANVFRLVRLKTKVPTRGVCVLFYQTILRTLWAPHPWKSLTEGREAHRGIGHSKKSAKSSVCKTSQINRPRSLLLTKAYSVLRIFTNKHGMLMGCLWWRSCTLLALRTPEVHKHLCSHLNFRYCKVLSPRENETPSKVTWREQRKCRSSWFPFLLDQIP